MDSGEAMELGRQAITLMLVLGCPVLLVGLIVGAVVGLLQATTQVQDQTLTFVPKIIAMLAAVLIFGGWMFTRLVEFAVETFGLP